MGKEGTEFWEKEQSKVLGDDRKEKGKRRMAYLTWAHLRWVSMNQWDSAWPKPPPIMNLWDHDSDVWSHISKHRLAGNDYPFDTSDLSAQVATNTTNIATDSSDIDSWWKASNTSSWNDTSILIGYAPQPTKVMGTSTSSLGMDCLTWGKSSTAVGNNAVSTASDKAAVGVNSLLSCTGGTNSCLGFDAGSHNWH